MINQKPQQSESFEKGKALFEKNCVACHYIGMDKIATAPALGGITKRRDKEWLYDYTRNSIGMFKNGDSIAIELRNQGWALMNSFPNLTDKNLDNIYHFVEMQFELTENEKTVTNNDLTFGDFVDLEKLDSAEMINNSGRFKLSNKQIEKLKDELSEMAYVPNFSAKVGAISMTLLIDGKKNYISSATHGDYIEVHRSIVTQNTSLLETSDWLYFKTGEVNFDNYKKENE
ncbi:c-type cytochrome [Winogradskyella sp.]|uniref:c-type cytochrome n=1 Tax=Winogradskyella sp. TaxID=1883156 RepID=UPI003BAB2493